MGRKRTSMPFTEAREIVRAERIESVSQYKAWHDLNKPVGIPRRPDRAYEKVFISWNDFLGNDNPFPIIKHTWRSFNEARAFAQSLNIPIKQKWLDMCDAGDKPHDIPRRPDLYYRKQGEWISWGNFLGVTLAARSDVIEETETIFFMIYNPKAPRNCFRCGITNGGLSSISDFLRKVNGRAVATYFVQQGFDVDEFMTDLDGEEDGEHKGYYHVPNVQLVISELSILFNRAS